MPTLLLSPTLPEGDGLDGTVGFLLLAARDAADRDAAADGSVRAEEIGRGTFGPGFFLAPKIHVRPSRAQRVQEPPPIVGPLHLICTWGGGLGFQRVGGEGSEVWVNWWGGWRVL